MHNDPSHKQARLSPRRTKMEDSSSGPHRSHAVPAWGACRRRKTYCVFEGSQETCVLCRLKNTSCLRAGQSILVPPDGITSPRKRRRHEANANDDALNASAETAVRRSSKPLVVTHGTTTAEPGALIECGLHVIGPLATSDKEVLESPPPELTGLGGRKQP